MKIREIRALGLYGATPEGGWSNELQPGAPASELRFQIKIDRHVE